MRISNRDWIKLSAYLDGELSPRETRKLESRLEEQPDFQAALKELKDLKGILAATPRVPLPRSFTLSPALAKVQPKRVGMGGFRLAAAAMSFLFIAVVVVDLGTGLLKSAGAPALAPRAEEVMQKAPEVGEADAFEEEAALAGESAPAGEEATGNQDQAAEPALAAQEEAPAEAELESAPSDAAAEAAQGSGGEGIASAPTPPASEADRGQTGQTEEELQEGQELNGSPQVTSEPGQDEFISAEGEQAAELPTGGSPPGIRIAEIVLGLGAVGFAIAAWMRRRK